MRRCRSRGRAMRGEGTEREGSMTSVVLGLFALRHFERCAAVL